MSEIKGLGFIPSPEDRRDILMSTILPVFSAPRKVDYTEQMTAVRDQGEEGTCVGFACAVGLKEYQEKKNAQLTLAFHQDFYIKSVKRGMEFLIKKVLILRLH